MEEGSYVKAGDTLVILDSPDVEAKLQQAKAAEMAASALNQKANKGTREEQIRGAYEMWQKALAGLDVAKKSYERVQSLYEKEAFLRRKGMRLRLTIKLCWLLNRLQSHNMRWL